MWLGGGEPKRGRSRGSSAMVASPSHWLPAASSSGAPLRLMLAILNPGSHLRLPVSIVVAIIALLATPGTSDKGPGIWLQVILSAAIRAIAFEICPSKEIPKAI